MTVKVKYLAPERYGVLDSNRGLWRWIFPTYLDADKNKFRAINDRSSNFLKGKKLALSLTKIGVKPRIAPRAQAIQDLDLSAFD